MKYWFSKIAVMAFFLKNSKTYRLVVLVYQGVRTITSWTIAPWTITSGQFPLDNCLLGQLPPRTIARQDICPPDNCPSGQLHPDNCTNSHGWFFNPESHITWRYQVLQKNIWIWWVFNLANFSEKSCRTKLL